LIVRFETISINTLSFTKSAFGEQGVTQTLWFKVTIPSPMMEILGGLKTQSQTTAGSMSG